jgi:hypothetical protein
MTGLWINLIQVEFCLGENYRSRAGLGIAEIAIYIDSRFYKSGETIDRLN